MGGWVEGARRVGAHLELVGAAGTVLLDLHQHLVLQLVQQRVQRLELALQVLLRPRRVGLVATPGVVSGCHPTRVLDPGGPG